MDSGLKTRLIGALVLIALAVIFVPMLLPGNRGHGSQSGIAVPPEPSGELQTRVLQVGPDAAAAGSDTQAAVVDPDRVATLDLDKSRPRASTPAATASVASAPPIEATTPPAQVSASAPPHASAPPKPAVTPAPAIAKSSTPTVAQAPTSAVAMTRTPYPMPPLPGGAGAAAGAVYTVNLGIYADHASADKLVASAKQHGFTALATQETYQGKSVKRVRVGPFNSRADAEAARLKLKGFEHVPMTVESAVIPRTGDAPASALPATQPGAWAVQLAAYSDEASANKLRDRLRALGFDGYVDSVKGAKGTLWRVRAGPFTSRDVASEMRGRIADRTKITGNIVTQE